MKLTYRFAASDRRGQRTATCILFLLAYFLISGCRESPTTAWSAEAKSPNGDWVAVARSQYGGAFGATYNVTAVTLNRTKGSQPPTQVLLFSHEYPTMNLKMEWLSPTHLNVIYGPSTRPDDYADLNFQAIKSAGIEISVQSLSTEAANASH